MAKYRVIFDKEACIGVLACVPVNPKYWESDDQGKVILKGGKLNKDGKWEIIIDEKDLQMNIDSAEICPVLAIVVEKIEK